MRFVYFQFGLFLVGGFFFFLSLESVAKYTAFSHISVLAGDAQIEVLVSHTYTHTLKKSTRAQLAVAFASEVKANQNLTTVLATEGSSVF